MKLLAILFDLDNTLIPTRKADEHAVSKLADILISKHSVSVDVAPVICTRYLKKFRKCPDNPMMNLDIWRQLLWEQALGDRYKHLTEQVYQTWLNLRYHCLSLDPEIKKLLKALRKNYFIGLITNGTSSAQWEKIDKLELKPMFDLILVSGDLPWEKPHKRIFLEACEVLNVEPHQCIIVGDKLETDILGGVFSKLGGTVWIPLEHDHHLEPDPVPDFIIRTILDLPKVLELNHLPQIPTVNNRIFTEMEDTNSNGSDGS